MSAYATQEWPSALGDDESIRHAPDEVCVLIQLQKPVSIPKDTGR